MVQRQAIRIYWIGSALAVGEAFLLFTLGLELRTEQVWTLVLFGFPAPLIMYLCDHWLIKRHVQPIDAALGLLTGGYPIAPPVAYHAYLQALNLPVLTLLRVLLVHAPSVLIPATLLMLLANQVADLGLTWWQLCVIWSLWPITAAPHAIVEYFLIDRYMRRVLDRLEPLIGETLITPIPPASLGATLRLLAGAPLDTPQLIRTATGTQLALLFVFVSLMPMCVLGGSVYLKVTAVSPSASEVSFTALGPWIACLILLSAGVTIAIVTLMSRRVHSAMTDLLGKMRQVLEGDLSGHWSPRTTDEFFDLGIGFNAMLLGLRERETIKDTFGRFVSHEVAEVVLDGRVPLNGEVREVTILFQDIRGFTSLSERTPPVALLQLVNDFFTEMVAAVEAHGGIVKQFLGDGVMALFGVPAVHADAPARAVHTALDMLARLEGFNTRRQAQGEAPLRIGVGIHTGEVIAGCIGPDTRLEYGVVGDAVNLASRVQELTKQVGTAILVTDDTAARLGAGFVLGTRTVLTVRGKTQPIGVIEVLGARPGVPAVPVLVSGP